MHRLRLALPYFEMGGWQATVLAIKPEYVELSKDPMLSEGLSDYAEIIRINALSQNWTRKLGLGNLGIRAIYPLLKKGNQLLRSESFDLIYFSTTVFDCMVLGRYWLNKFGVKFVIDLQDPWRNDYHLTEDADERPAKFWFDYRLKSFTEKVTMPHVAGITAVTQQYINTVKQRYPIIQNTPSLELTFGADERDFAVADTLNIKNTIFMKEEGGVHIVYTGVVPESMLFCLKAIFLGLKDILESHKGIMLHFIGTNYAIDNRVTERVMPLAMECGIKQYVTEHAQRLPYFEALKAMKSADILLLPGTMDCNYTASKLYPYILARKPMLAIFNENSNASEILSRLNSAELITFSQNLIENIGEDVAHAMREMIRKIPFEPETKWREFDEYTASKMTNKLTDFFDRILVSENKT